MAKTDKDLFTLILKALAQQPKKLKKLPSRHPKPSDDFKVLLPIPTHLWGLYNLMVDMSAAVPRKIPRTEADTIAYKTAVVRSDTMTSVWWTIVKDEIPVTQKYLLLQCDEGNIVGAQFVDTAPQYLHIVNTLIAAKISKRDPAGITPRKPPKDGKLFAKMSSTYATLVHQSLRLQAQGSVVRDAGLVLGSILRDIVDQKYADKLGEAVAGLVPADDGNFYTVPAQHQLLPPELAEMLRGMGDMQVVEVTLGKPPKLHS